MVPAGQRYLLYASEVYALAVLRPLQTAIRRAGGEAAWFFDGPGQRHLTPDERCLLSVDDVRAFDPVAVFVPGNQVPDFFPGVKVEVFHGFSVGKRSDRRGHFRVRGLFDLYCTHGGTTTPTFRELARRHGHFDVVETGWPKIDPLFWPSDRKASAWRAGWPEERPVILYASTFTRGLSSAPVLAEPIRRLSRSGRFGWLITMHPKMPREVVLRYREMQGPDLRFVETDDVVSLLQAADLMVSDTSSVVFEFLMQHRPVVTFRNTRPGPHLIDIDDPAALERAIERGLRVEPEQMRAIAEFADRIHPYRDGRSSERVLEATHEFISGRHRALKRKPRNLVRRLKLRHKLRYYRWR